jgi:hypothetical protein
VINNKKGRIGMNRKVLAVALLLLFIGASGVCAQMKTIEDKDGVIVYGVVNADRTAVAMGSILRNVQNNCGERPQIGQVFRVRGSNTDAVFFTVTNRSHGNKQVAGLIIASQAGPNQVQAAMLSGDANSFGSTLNPMLNRLTREWHPNEQAQSGRGVSAPPMPLQRAMLPDRSASVSVPRGWMVKGGGGTATIIETNYNANININMVRGAANPGSRQYGPRNGMGAKIIYPSNIDPVRGVAGLIKEFYRMSGVNIDFRVENASIIAGPPRQRCVHAVGHGLLGNNPVQPGNYWEMDALVCTTAPNQMGEYTVTLTLSDIDPKFADRLRATVAAIFMSYEVDQAVVSGQAGAIAAPAIAAIHQIGATATARMQANDRANERQHNDWNAEQDLKARQNQGFHNYILDQSVVQNNNVFGTGAVGHSTEWNSVANALVKADPKKYEIVGYPNFWEGTDFRR